MLSAAGGRGLDGASRVLLSAPTVGGVKTATGLAGLHFSRSRESAGRSGTPDASRSSAV